MLSLLAQTAGTTSGGAMETAVFMIAAAAVLAGAIGVVANQNPVYSALSLVGTLFGVAILFLLQEAHFLAAVQVIVYAGAIVVLFLFVIMLLGVDRTEDLSVEPIVGQRTVAALVAVVVAALPIAALASTGWKATGVRSQFGSIATAARPDISELGEVIFTDYLFAFEITSVLLVIAVVGAVLLSRRSRLADEIEVPDGPVLEPLLGRRNRATDDGAERSHPDDDSEGASADTASADDEEVDA